VLNTRRQKHKDRSWDRIRNTGNRNNSTDNRDIPIRLIQSRSPGPNNDHHRSSRAHRNIRPGSHRRRRIRLESYPHLRIRLGPLHQLRARLLHRHYGRHLVVRKQEKAELVKGDR
jgi:hypothetical protein